MAADDGAPAGGRAGNTEGLRLAARSESHVLAPVQLPPGPCTERGARVHADYATTLPHGRWQRCTATSCTLSAILRVAYRVSHTVFKSQKECVCVPAAVCGGTCAPARSLAIIEQAFECPVARVALGRVIGRGERIAQDGGCWRPRRQTVLQPRRAAAGRPKVQPFCGRDAVKCLEFA